LDGSDRWNLQNLFLTRHGKGTVPASLDLEAPQWRYGDNLVHGVKLCLNESCWSGFQWMTETATRGDIFQSSDDDNSIVQMFPYWLIAIPSTLIAFLLLLTRPHKAASKNHVETVT
jgi:hypothetical protein